MYKKQISAFVQTTDTVANTASKTSFFTSLNMHPTQQVNTIGDPRYGQAFDIDIMGWVSTIATPGTLTMTIDWGSGGSGTTLAILGTTGAVTLAGNLANTFWRISGRLIFATTGPNNGIATFTGLLEVVGAANALFGYPMMIVGNGNTGWIASVPTTGEPFNDVKCSVQWQTADPGNTVTMGGGSKFEQVA